MIHRVITGLLASAGILLVTSCAPQSPGTDDSSTNSSATNRSACRHFTEVRQPFFGDLHVHTVFSLDANTQDTRTHPRDSYRFAKGEQIGVQPFDDDDNPTRFLQLLRPLDFAAVTDHVELFGEVEICTNEEEYPVEYNSPDCQFYRQSPENAFLYFNFVQLGLPLAQFPDELAALSAIPGFSDIPLTGAGGNVPRLAFCGPNGETCLEAAKKPWGEIQVAAEEHYDRSDNCEFTTFVAYEYTGAPRSNNLHRNVIFRSEIVPEQPPAYQEHTTEEKLWAALADRCRNEDGCDYLTIPHNSNISGGLMFDIPDGDPAYNADRQLNEPLAEIYQHKGQSECLGTTGAGLADELCGFEIVPYDNLSGNRFGGANAGPPREGDYLRSALKDGIRREAVDGVNPFKYGFIGSTDTHLGTPGLIDEKDYPGHGGASTATGDGLVDEIEYSPGGLAVFWAEENTRDSLYAAMRRREAYATTGNRPTVRFFGGWDLPVNMCSRADFAEVGYANGVPMGGDLPTRPTDATTPLFFVGALRDFGVTGSNAEPLQRIQIIKGWVDSSGTPQEQVYDIAGSANNGGAVDPLSCATNGVGSTALCNVWQDPNFDASEQAFYYARVVENPSCRWSTRQCNDAGITEAFCADANNTPPAGLEGCCDDRFERIIQERAWTSPIWYSP